MGLPGPAQPDGPRRPQTVISGLVHLAVCSVEGEHLLQDHMASGKAWWRPTRMWIGLSRGYLEARIFTFCDRRKCALNAAIVEFVAEGHLEAPLCISRMRTLLCTFDVLLPVLLQRIRPKVLGVPLR